VELNSKEIKALDKVYVITSDSSNQITGVKKGVVIYAPRKRFFKYFNKFYVVCIDKNKEYKTKKQLIKIND
jgi:hypothetical protein